MMRKWLARTALACAAGVAASAVIASPAYAADKWLYLEDSAHQYASMVFVDAGDVFKIYDDRADGYGPTGTLQIYNAGLLRWEDVESKHNGAGDGNPVSFQHNVVYPWYYRMKLCQTNAGCDYSSRFQE
jgi:hypothetical protein